MKVKAFSCAPRISRWCERLEGEEGKVCRAVHVFIHLATWPHHQHKHPIMLNVHDWCPACTILSYTPTYRQHQINILQPRSRNSRIFRLLLAQHQTIFQSSLWTRVTLGETRLTMFQANDIHSLPISSRGMWIEKVSGTGKRNPRWLASVDRLSGDLLNGAQDRLRHS